MKSENHRKTESESKLKKTFAAPALVMCEQELVFELKPSPQNQLGDLVNNIDSYLLDKLRYPGTLKLHARNYSDSYSPQLLHQRGQFFLFHIYYV
jgi:hypothetical protein